MLEFLELNLNPTGKRKGDCVVRAICKATKQPWIKVYRDLCDIGSQEYEMPTSPNVYQKYLKQLGWKKMPMPKVIIPIIIFGKGTTSKGTSYRRVKAKELAESLKDTDSIIISLANHLTMAQYGTIHDTWNCGNKYCGNYWIK